MLSCFHSSVFHSLFSFCFGEIHVHDLGGRVFLHCGCHRSSICACGMFGSGYIDTSLRGALSQGVFPFLFYVLLSNMLACFLVLGIRQMSSSRAGWLCSSV